MKRIVYGIAGLLLLAFAAGAYWHWRGRFSGESPYQAVAVARGDLETFVLTTGIAQPQNRLEIKSPVAGRVEEALVREGDAVRRGQILAWMSSSERAALLDAARAKGETELAYWEQLYKPTPLVAPLDGVIIARNIEPGQTVTAADVLYVLSDRLIIQAQVDETDIGRIALRQPAVITLDAYPQESFTGAVDEVAFEAKTVNNVTTYMVDILPETVPPFLRSGMTANIRVLTAVTNGVLILPTEAVHTENGRKVVWQPNPEDPGKPLSRPVTTGLSDGKRVELLSGLQEGEAVLVHAAFKTAVPEKENQQKNPFMPSRPRRR